MIRALYSTQLQQTLRQHCQYLRRTSQTWCSKSCWCSHSLSTATAMEGSSVQRSRNVLYGLNGWQSKQCSCFHLSYVATYASVTMSISLVSGDGVVGQMHRFLVMTSLVMACWAHALIETEGIAAARTLFDRLNRTAHLA